MSNKKTPDEIQGGIDTISKLPGVPEWMLNAENYASNKPLRPEELFEFAEFCTKQYRKTAALYYLNSCTDRFGFSESGQRIFRAPGLIVEIDQNVIETLLIHQVERYLIEERPEDKYITPMQFYMGDEVNRKENGSTWLIDFIDGVFIEGANEFKNLFDDCGSTIH